MARQPEIVFKTIQLFKDQTLGIGSYGKVCRAKCDDLLCAAKLIHETLFDPTAQQLIAPQREHRLPMKRFEQECEFLSTIRHPNIVQYLGIYRDPDTGLPALLMELMDDSLTHFLESSLQPISYHIQVNICHDIALALSFLHSNGIIHRDLSSNNVLLIGNVRAKVTDFGMARLGDQNPQASQLTFTMCPGTDVYMPPEAVQEEPVYTEKMDCFSFGVIAVQIVTQQFPKPSNRKRRVSISHPDLPSDTIVEVPILEIERRQNHISTIDPNHILLPIVHDCLKNRDVERPSGQQLCERVAVLKEDPQYSESVRVAEARGLAEQDRSDERDRELRSLRQQYSQQIQDLQRSQMSHLAEKDQIIVRRDQSIIQKDQALREKDEIITELKQQVSETERERDVVIEEKERELRQKVSEINQFERQLGSVNQQLEESERVIAQFQRQIAELEQLRSATDTSSSSKEQRTSFKLTWREGEKTPYGMSLSYCAATDGSTLYVRGAYPNQMFSYIVSTSRWSQLPNSPTNNCSSVILNNLLTLIGGHNRGSTLTNQLFSLTGEGSGRRWTEKFPPMPTKRQESIALCTGTALIVAGGTGKDDSALKAVEVLNTETLQWSTAADLPQPLPYVPAAVCGGHVYILGSSNMYISSIITLCQSSRSFLASLINMDTGVWKKVAAPPVKETTCLSIGDRLISIGGKGADERITAAVHLYNPTTDSWEVISYMGTPRKRCIAAVLPNNQLMVVGGKISSFVSTDSVEFATVE